MDVSSSNTNTGNVEGKSVASRRMGQEKVVIIESDMDDDMQFAAKWKDLADKLRNQKNKNYLSELI